MTEWPSLAVFVNCKLALFSSALSLLWLHSDSIYFNEDFYSRITKDVGGNWRIRVSGFSYSKVVSSMLTG